MYYETIFIVNPDISQENTEKLTDNLIARVEKSGGRIVKREYWGVRQLAYSIAKRKRGHYVLLVTDGEAAAIRALEEGIQLEESILRFLTTRLTDLSDEPSPLLRRKPEASAADKAGEEGPAAEKTTDTEAATEKMTGKETRVEETSASEEAENTAADEEEATEKKAPAKKKVAGKSEEKADA
ncbi:MAG: 30S ribosomal protein S6 [Mariprofundaceae bacterium]|nr:30S ribosomal protein S6 [Mariprofundaceae bacterium]